MVALRSGTYTNVPISVTGEGVKRVDVDELYVKEITVDSGPSMKRIRPAPQGRAFRILKRMSHITIRLDRKPVEDNERS